MLTKKIIENFRSNSRKLFQIVQNFFETTHYFEFFEIFILVKNFHVNFFFDRIVKKIDFDVYLFLFSIICDDNDENNFIIHRFNHDDENFVIIKILDLFKIANALTSFISNNFVVDISFDFINSFFDKNFSICRNENYQNLCFIVFVKFHFFIYFELLFHFVINVNHCLFVNFKFVRIHKRNFD